MTLLPGLAAIGLWLTLVTALAFGISVLSSRRLIWNIADPLLLVLLNVALNVAIVVVLADERHREVLWYVIVAFAAFLAGLHAFGPPEPIDRSVEGIRAPGRTATLLLLSTAAAFYLIYDAFLVSQVGLGVFAGGNPDIVKVTVTQGGFGIFRHFYVAANLFYLPLLVHSYVVYRRRWVVTLGVLLFLMQNVVFNFSKSGFVFAVFDLGVIAYFYQHALGRTLVSFRTVVIAAMAGLVPALVVVSIVSAINGVSISEMIITRLAATGSGTYMYFLLDGSAAFYRMGFADRASLFLDILLSSLRLKAWAPLSFSGMVSTQITGVELPGFGANPYPFVAGHYLFGWGGVLYCLAVGAGLSFVRTRRVNLLAFFVLNQMAIVFVADPGITQSDVIALLVISPAIAVTFLIGQIQRRRLLVPVRSAYARWVTDRRGRHRVTA